VTTAAAIYGMPRLVAPAPAAAAPSPADAPTVATTANHAVSAAPAGLLQSPLFLLVVLVLGAFLLARYAEHGKWMGIR